MRIGIWASLMLLVPAAGLYAGAAEDDLAVVKRAVAEHAKPAPPSPAPAEEARPQARQSGKEPKWLRVRIVDKKEKKARVSVNLPLGLVRAFGDDIKLDEGWRGHDGKRITLGDVLRALDAGQSLVEVDDANASVRVWIE